MRYRYVFHWGFLAISLASFFAAAAIAQSEQEAPVASAPYSADLKDLVVQILNRAEKAKCHPQNCTILVTDVITPNGSTSRLGMQLADALSAEIDAQGNGIRVVDRRQAEAYVAHEYFDSAYYADRKALNWLGKQLKANAVLFGKIEKRGQKYNLKIELMNISNDKKGPEEERAISIDDAKSAFSEFEPYYATSPPAPLRSPGSPKPFQAGVKGTGVPTCISCPGPVFPGFLRNQEIMGNVILSVIVTEEGRVSDIHVVSGRPDILTAAAMRAVSQWTFKPATHEGKPVAVIVPIQITFRTD